MIPWAEGEHSDIRGGREGAETKLATIDPVAYARTRNDGDGAITRLSSYLQHGIVSLNEVRNRALERCGEPQQAGKFLQELGWRDFWQRVLLRHPEYAWEDAESHKTGFIAKDYSGDLPDDIRAMGSEHVQQQTIYFTIENVDRYFGTLVDTSP